MHKLRLQNAKLIDRCNKLIDVTIATKNNGRTIGNCLQAIRANIPFRSIIVIDGQSTDNTLQIARSLGAKIFIDTGLLGKIRYAQAEHCETQWIAYVDSDVYVYPSWWAEVSKFTGVPDVGMISALGHSPIDRLPIYEDYLSYMARKYGNVAFSNTLVRRDLVLSCRELLSNIHAGEDSILARHITNLDMRIITIPEQLVFHDKNTFHEHPGAFLRWGCSARILGGIAGIRNVAKTLRNNLRNWWIFTSETRQLSFSLLLYLIFLWGCTLKGYLIRQSK
jgi:glycosyltransferase involved in cell wall biosynthesis